MMQLIKMRHSSRRVDGQQHALLLHSNSFAVVLFSLHCPALTGGHLQAVFILSIWGHAVQSKVTRLLKMMDISHEMSYVR